MSKFVQVGLIVLAATVLAACSSPPDDSAASKAKKEEAEYVYYTPTGSNIPIRVRKSDVKPTSEETVASQAVLDEWQRRGRAAPTRP